MADKWEILTVVSGQLQAELIGGLLTAQGVETRLAQEGAGRAIGIGVGPLGEVEVLVRSSQIETAHTVLDDYYSGKFEDVNFEDAE